MKRPHFYTSPRCDFPDCIAPATGVNDGRLACDAHRLEDHAAPRAPREILTQRLEEALRLLGGPRSPPRAPIVPGICEMFDCPRPQAFLLRRSPDADDDLQICAEHAADTNLEGERVALASAQETP